MAKHPIPSPRILSAALGAAALAFAGGCALQFKPLKDEAAGNDAAAAKAGDPRVVARFFDDDFVSGGYQYTYPDAAKVFIPEESGHESDVSLQFDLIADDYSGGSVCLYNLLYDLTPYYSRGALQFWVKGAKGGEVAWVALVDDENRDGMKTVVRLPLNDHGGITAEWRLVSIPLAKFGRKGVFWDAKKRVEVPHTFDWNAVAEFRIEIKKGDNQSFRAWADDIQVLRDVYEPAVEKPSEDWDEKQETVPMPPVAEAKHGKILHTLFGDDIPAGGFPYVYGGRTRAKVQPTTESGKGVLAAYMDGNEFSGVTIALGAGKNVDIRKPREGRGALAFWGKGGPGVRSIYIGLLDSRADGVKSQSKQILGDFGPIDTAWHYYQIPLKRFINTGMYWDAAKQAEISAEMKWDQIGEVRFSISKDENRVGPGQFVPFYVKDVVITDDIPGYVDPDEYWTNFKSNEPDRMLHDFEGGGKGWETGHGPKSEVSFAVDASTGHPGKSLAITYRLADWCDVVYRYDANNAPAKNRDWTKHYGLRLKLYSPKAFQGVTIQVGDAGKELFVANTGAGRGWTEVVVPFRAFSKFPYYQPPEAVQNSKFDMDAITSIDFKAAGDGTSGTFRVDDVSLTNLREAPKVKALAKREFKIVGESKVLTSSINDGIFGINAALWDGDLLDRKTVDYVKAVNHKVIRYPGGLRADDDHWKQVLDKKDGMVDTDEFLEWLKQTGNEAMITVNFGKGTPQEAADWVKHVNITRKAGVKLWEVGNELYGDWHPQHTTGEDYGKRTAEFIKAMKAVDPTIQVAVVWVLDGEWNKHVLQATKDLADAVIIHHYPQHAGEENDQALLSAPQSLNEIIPSVKRQIKEYGAPGKQYGIWLTEWNSVDFKPGPQTLGLVNGLFVIDYLGMLARHNIEHADYWDIHNNLTEQGGDYGYLSRTGAPDGDIVPRPSYHGFKLASEALRGKLLDCKVKTSDADAESDVTCYLSERPNGGKSVLLVNKHPETEAAITVSVPGWKGNGVLKKLDKSNSKTGPGQGERISLSESIKVSLPPYSAAAILQD